MKVLVKEIRAKINEIGSIIVKFNKLLASTFIEGEKLSIGRVLLMITFILSVIQWRHNIDISATHFNALLLFSGYVFGSKVTSTINGIAVNKTPRTPTQYPTQGSPDDEPIDMSGKPPMMD
jgi:hypothetical protein